jgi:predicted MPP superfamily phosphohydrolase
MARISRRKFLGLSALALPAALGIDARLIEPTNLRISNLKRGQSGCRFVHFTDLHHKGNVRYAAEVIRTINDLNPQFVCFTGDLIENTIFQSEALSFIRQIEAPVYGSPGNHDYWSGANFAEYERTFAKTGGAWLVDHSVVLPEHDLELVGMGMIGIHAPAFKDRQATRRVLLMHYPLMADSLGAKFDLILAGHSHGGQVRIPFYGAIAVPWGVGPYDLGLFETPSGPLYVNAGIGTYRIPYRFNCRPEITVVNI